jgi:FKBP-type peptidyl-prolyl cis-trans isomerase FkpA
MALVSALLVSYCGGTTEPPQQAPPARETPAPEAAPPPASAPGGASTSAPGGATADKTADKPAPGAPASEPPAQTRKVDKPAAPVAPGAPARPAYTRTDLQVGTGREAQKGKGLSVHYTGWLYDPARPDMKGRMFDSSKERGPFEFVLGAGQVIPGWDQGFDGMKIGGRRRLIIPSALAYGVDGAGGGIIPPNATLIFEMELLDVQQ